MSLSNIKVLIGDDSAETGVSTANMLRERGIRAYTSQKDCDVILEGIKEYSPDVVILDITNQNDDVVTIMKKARESGVKSPVFIVISSYDNEFTKQQVMYNGALKFLPKPYDIDDLCAAIKSAVLDNANSHYMETVVTDIINQLGVPAKIKGYKYLRTAILCSINDKTLLDSVPKLLYPTVAGIYETTSSRVNRAIRHAIEIAWDIGNVELLNDFFGYTVGSINETPTNSEFIATITDKICLKYKSKQKDNMEMVVTDMIHQLGVPAHIQGYKYLRTAILCSINDKTLLDSVPKLLYPTVAGIYDTYSSRVERAIRHAIEIAWDRGNVELLNDFFGYTVGSINETPTNSEFIAIVIDKIRMKYKSKLKDN